MSRIVFMGTPDFAVPTLKKLIHNHDLIGVVTQPDRPAGRKGKITPPPVKTVALEAGIPVYQPEKVRAGEAIRQLQQWQPEVYVVAAFGQILSQDVLDIPPYGSINVHASLLPRWRGAAPIQAAIRSGDAETGVTIMKMDAGLDTGPVLSSATIPIEGDETGQTLHDKLAELGADLLMNTLPAYMSGTLQPQSQPEEGVTIAPRIEKSEGHIDWKQDAASIERLVRAFTPWPGTFTEWKGRQLKIHTGEVVEGRAEPGHVIETGGRVAIGTGEGLYCPTRVQLAGKKTVTLDDFVRGHRDFVGSDLGK
jgi:methionyl-tRNA formyltransferase